MKKCTRCGQTKDFSEFYRRAKSIDGLQTVCKSCKGGIDKEYRSTEEGAAIYQRSVDKFRSKHKRTLCIVIDNDWEYRERLAEEEWIAEQNRIKYSDRSIVSQISIEWRRDSEMSAAFKTAKHRRDRERNMKDPAFVVASLMRSRINKLFVEGRKSISTLDSLGCSYTELMQHLESQFTNGMTWENRGTYWHIDHVIPCAFFNQGNESDFRCCHHYTNLRPLPASENCRKQDRMPDIEGLLGWSCPL